MARVFGSLELRYIQEVLENGRLGSREGGMVAQFEKAFARSVGTKFGIACNSGMTGLAQAVSVSGAGVGTEIICDPLIYSGALAAFYFNAVPRFADVEYETYLMDPESVIQNITGQTKALIVTNLWGLCARLDELRTICNDHGIFMIEDCAYAVGAYWKDKHAGTYGDLAVFDFNQDRQITTGEGGMIVTAREDLYKRLREESAPEKKPPEFMIMNFRMNEVTAAIGYSQLQRSKAYLEEYSLNLEMLNDAIDGCEWLRKRVVPGSAKQSGYVWSCLWEGDKHGLNYDHFQQICKEMEVPFQFGTMQKPVYLHDLFRHPTAYNHENCPVRCPYYESDYINHSYHEGLCPIAEDLAPRIILSDIMEVSERELNRRVSLLHKAIHRMERSS